MKPDGEDLKGLLKRAEEEPGDLSLIMRLAPLLIREGMPGKAAELLKRLPEEKSEAPAVLGLWGDIMQAEAKGEHAESFYRRSLEKRFSPGMAVKLIRMIMKRGDMEGALKTLERFLLEGAGEKSLLSMKGEIMKRMGREEERPLFSLLETQRYPGRETMEELRVSDRVKILKINIIDEKIHSGAPDLLTMMKEVRLWFELHLSEITGSLGRNSALILFSDHGFVEKVEHPEPGKRAGSLWGTYSHSLSSPWESIVPVSILVR